MCSVWFVEGMHEELLIMQNCQYGTCASSVSLQMSSFEQKREQLASFYYVSDVHFLK